MKQSSTLTPCLFDDKDIIVDGDLWEWFFEQGPFIPYCHNDYTALFFIGNQGFSATIRDRKENVITVRPVTNNLIVGEASSKIKDIFTSWNNEEDSDIYVDHFSHYKENTRYPDFMVFHYFKTTD